MKRPVLGITLGDPAGIGPEIVVKALHKKATFEDCEFTVGLEILRTSADHGSALNIAG